MELSIWYAAPDPSALYPDSKENPTHAVLPARIFGKDSPSPALIRRALLDRNAIWILVGWSNPSTRALIPLLSVLGRSYGFYTDEPAPSQGGPSARRAARDVYLRLLRRRATVFATGRNAVAYFRNRGFREERVCNLPIPTPAWTNLEEIRGRRAELRRRFGADDDRLFVASGSRFVREKGYDLLLEALARLGAAERGRIKLLLVGSGPEEQALKALARERGLGDRVVFEPWMESDDFIACLAAADVVVHPARFDGYGAAALLAASLGVAVVGSTKAGAAAELIEPGVSGFLYEPEDVEALAGHLRRFLEQPELATALGEAALRRADRWSPERTAEVLVRRLGLL